MIKILLQTKTYIGLFIAALIAVWLLISMGLRPVSGAGAPVRVVILKGTTAREISENLQDRGLIRSPFMFRLACKWSGSSNKLKPGVYELSPRMSVPKIIDELVEGKLLESWVTLPEGFTARQMADILAKKQLVDGDAFVRLAITKGYEFSEYPFINGDNLEGYLFPDTYLVARGTDSQDIIRKMLDAFEEKIASPYRREIENVIRERFGLGPDSFDEGLYRLLIVASLVEREAKVPKDRPLIAAVIWNRLAKGMRLEIDAAGSYSPGESTGNKSRLYYRDLKTDTPYNTYLHAGLPPTPICNPGLASFKAVLKPAQVDYLFYVAHDGSHIFSRTFQEHIAAKNAARNGGH
ncbi:MAG: endolytic transglycosylase MltG [Armatimonadota bacterium]|nr:endolytic transglycosylase MltG [bacterium]